MAVEIPKRLEDLPTSEVRYVGKDVNRIEDPKLVTGRTEYIDNFELPGMLHCAILRSVHPHARINAIDTSQAEKLPGVVAIVTGEDALRWSHPGATVPEGWGTHCLATEKVRFVGEPVAAVAAVSRYVAEDALELIDVDYDSLEPVVDPAKAALDESPKLFEEHGSNVILHRLFTWGDVDDTFANAAHVYEDTFRWNRMGANPMETFGVVSQWDLTEDSVKCWGSFQSAYHMGLGVAGTLGLPANRVTMASHPHGGSFGGKGGPRGACIAALLSRKSSGKPVKWIEDRIEYLTAGSSQAWDRHYEAAIAVDGDGRIAGFRVKLLDDLGATAEGFGAVSAGKPLAAFTGCYAIPVAQYDLTLVATNKLPASPYRGMGPPPHNYVLESLVDTAARDLALDPAEMRRRNFIAPDAFPYTIASGNEYDSGEYEAALDAVLELSSYTDLRTRQAAARQEGRLVGIGVVNTIEPGVFDWNAYSSVGVQGVGVPEGVTVSIDIFGTITVRVGFSLEGQGQYTLAAQLIADYFGTTPEQVRVVYAATDVAPPHFGPGGSRLGVAITGAILGACEKLREKMSKVVAGLMQTEPEHIELMDGFFRVKGMPDAKMHVAEVSGTMLGRSDLLPPGEEPCPEATYVWTAQGRNEPDDQGRCKNYLTAANACHVCVVEVDPETGETKILDYFVADDCGTRLNPGNVEGMTQGGIAQGVGAALYEEYAYDDAAQPLVSTFMDYLIPTIGEVPLAKKVALVTPSPVTPLGAKGCGEGAIHTTPAAVMCAINDAIAHAGLRVTEVPASPLRLWRLLAPLRNE